MQNTICPILLHARRRRRDDNVARQNGFARESVRVALFVAGENRAEVSGFSHKWPCVASNVLVPSDGVVNRAMNSGLVKKGSSWQTIF